MWLLLLLLLVVGGRADSGENGNRGRANETTAQIRSKAANGQCLKFSASSRGGKGLYLETCNTDPPNCIVKRCFYSESLGDEEWYLADNGQLIASFVRGNGHQIPPLATTTTSFNAADPKVAYHGPIKGYLGGPEESSDRCGKMRGAKDMGSTPMCKNTTDDGKLYVSLAEIQARCTADGSSCAGFSEDTGDPSYGIYFRPLSHVSEISVDHKWQTWSKGPLPPAPAPRPSPSPSPSSPKDWYDAVDIPFCLASAPSTSPPKEPSQPPAISVPGCSSSKPTLLVFAGPLSGGGIVVGLANKCTGNHSITASWKDIGAKAGVTYSVRDVINGKDLTDATEASPVSSIVGEHDISVLRLTPK